MKRLAGLGLGLFLSTLSLSAQIDVDRTISIGRNAIHFQDYIVSLGYFNQVISLRPWMAEPYFYRAVAKINLDDYTGAEEDATLALERNPIYPRAYLLRGIARFNLKEYQHASEDFQKGLELSPRDQGLLYNLAIAQLEDKQLDKAEVTTRQLLQLDKRSKDAYRVLAQIALERKDTIATHQVADTLLQLDSAYRPAWLLKAQLASEQKDYRKALQALDRVLSLEPGDAGLYVNRAILRYHQLDLRGAMADYSEALRLEPNEQTALNNRALLRSQVGEYRLAIQDWTRLISLDKDNYIARFNRALLYSRTGQSTSALADLDIVLKRYPAFAAGFSARAELRQRLGDAKGAARDQVHLYDLQTDKNYRDRMNASGRHPQPSPQTRSEEDQAIEKYHLLVETPTAPERERPQYTSQIRGRIQDAQVQRSPRADLILSYFTEVNKDGNQGQVYFSGLLDRTNRLLGRHLQGLRLTLREAGSPLSLAEAHRVQEHLAHLEGIQDPSAEVLLLKGIDAFLLQDLEQTLRHLSQAIEKNPGLALAHYLQASALLRRSEVTATASNTGVAQTTPLKALNEAIRLAPDFAQAYYNRANLYAKTGDAIQARHDYDRAIALDSHLAEAFFNRGLLSYSEGKVKEGTSDLSRAGELGLYQAYGLIKRMNK